MAREVIEHDVPCTQISRLGTDLSSTATQPSAAGRGRVVRAGTGHTDRMRTLFIDAGTDPIPATGRSCGCAICRMQHGSSRTTGRCPSARPGSNGWTRRSPGARSRCCWSPTAWGCQSRMAVLITDTCRAHRGMMRVIVVPNAGGTGWQRRLPGELGGRQQRVGVVICARPGCDYVRLPSRSWRTGPAGRSPGRGI
jgi:hypothetical protein